MERDWVRIVGHRDVPGKPAMYATTRQFLDYFNLKSLEELPPLADIRDMEEVEPELSLDDDKPESRVLEFPSAEDMEDTFDVPDEEEEMAAAIGTRPIEEILGVVEEEEDDPELWDEEDSPEMAAATDPEPVHMSGENTTESVIGLEVEADVEGSDTPVASPESDSMEDETSSDEEGEETHQDQDS